MTVFDIKDQLSNMNANDLIQVQHETLKVLAQRVNSMDASTAQHIANAISTQGDDMYQLLKLAEDRVKEAS